MTNREYDKKIETIAFLNEQIEKAKAAGNENLVESLNCRILIEMMS